MRVAAYIRVSTEEQGRSGAGVEAQRAAILAEVKRRGWELVETFEDRGYSARDLKRPGVQAALDALESWRGVGSRCREARPPLALDARLHGDHGSCDQAIMGAGCARLRRRHDHARRGGDGERPRHLRAVRAAADRPADPGGARRQACGGGPAWAAINDPTQSRRAHPARARPWSHAAPDRRPAQHATGFPPRAAARSGARLRWRRY